jgi:hypothetical protein
MTHPEALEFLTRIGAEQTDSKGHWLLTVGTGVVHITHRQDNPENSRWCADPADSEVDFCYAADPQQALLDLGADLSDMATHCSSFGLAVTRLAV